MPPARRLAAIHKKLTRRFLTTQQRTSQPTEESPPPTAKKGCSSCGKAIQVPNENAAMRRGTLTHQRSLGFLGR